MPQTLTGDSRPTQSGERISMRHAYLSDMAIYAWNIDSTYQISAKDYRSLNDDPAYDIEARTSGSVSDAVLRQMFQNLLKERFGLETHWETREAQVYDLVAVSGGKLQATREGVKIGYYKTLLAPGTGGTVNLADGSHLVGKAAPVAVVLKAAASQFHVPVTDQTGLTGAYDFDVLFTSRNGMPKAEPAPLFESAIQSELGLKLVKRQGSFRMLIIDHVGKLTPN